MHNDELNLSWLGVNTKGVHEKKTMRKIGYTNGVGVEQWNTLRTVSICLNRIKREQKHHAQAYVDIKLTCVSFQNNAIHFWTCSVTFLTTWKWIYIKNWMELLIALFLILPSFLFIILCWCTHTHELVFVWARGCKKVHALKSKVNIFTSQSFFAPRIYA